MILVKKQRRIEFNSGMVGKKVEGAKPTAAGLPPVLPKGVMWGRWSGTSKYGLEYSSKPGSKQGNLKLALNMALNPAPKWAPNWISRYGFRVARNLLFEWGLHLFLILLITLSTVYKWPIYITNQCMRWSSLLPVGIRTISQAEATRTNNIYFIKKKWHKWISCVSRWSSLAFE